MQRGAGGQSPAVPADIGYVRVEEFSSTVQGADREFADAIQAQIRSRDAANLAGWIVDVRSNRGGNMWPMVAGVGAVPRRGRRRLFVPPSGAQTPWSYRAGAAFEWHNRNRAHIPGVCIARRCASRRRLDGQFVASSGEAVVVSFRARANTRSFGAATCGQSTANARFRLSDGATLQLTTSLMADRNSDRLWRTDPAGRAAERCGRRATRDRVASSALATAASPKRSECISELNVAQPFPPPLALDRRASYGETRRSAKREGGQGCRRPTGRPEGLRYERPPLILKRTLHGFH